MGSSAKHGSSHLSSCSRSPPCAMALVISEKERILFWTVGGLTWLDVHGMAGNFTALRSPSRGTWLPQGTGHHRVGKTEQCVTTVRCIAGGIVPPLRI